MLLILAQDVFLRMERVKNPWDFGGIPLRRPGNRGCALRSMKISRAAIAKG